MITKKTITFTWDDVDEVVLDIAEEIKKGFTLSNIKADPPSVMLGSRREYTVELERRPDPCPY